MSTETSTGAISRSLRPIAQPIFYVTLGLAFLEFALPIYGRNLGASALEIGALFSIATAMIAFLRPIIGWLLDRVGRRAFFIAALACYAISMGLFGLSGGLPMLYAAQLVRGLGAAMLWVSAYTMATDLTARERRGAAVGHIDEAAARGQLYGGIVGFALISLLPPTVDWKVVFFGYAILAALGALQGWRYTPETQPRGDDSLADRAISRHLLRLMLVVFVTAASASMTRPLFLIYLQDRFTTDIGTLVLAIIPAGLVASYLPSRLGGLSDRLGRVQLIALGLLGSALVSLSIPILPSLLPLVVFWTLESLGWAIAAPAEEALVADLTGLQVRGTGYGLYTFTASLGAMIGPLAGGWLYDTVGRAAPFYLNSAVLLVGAVLLVLLLRPRAIGRGEIEALEKIA